jgi:hypothetical protein
MRSAYWVAISAALLSSAAIASDGRYEAARRTGLEVAINSAPFIGKEIEALCFATEVDVKAIQCAVLNEVDEESGRAIYFLEQIDPEAGADLVTECGNGRLPSGTVRPSCRLYLKAKIDENGHLFALSYEQAEVRE